MSGPKGSISLDTKAYAVKDRISEESDLQMTKNYAKNILAGEADIRATCVLPECVSSSDGATSLPPELSSFASQLHKKPDQSSVQC